jgi:hypothetical protein
VERTATELGLKGTMRSNKQLTQNDSETIRGGITDK